MLFRKKRVEQEIIERKVPIMDKKVSSWIYKLSLAYDDELSLEELKEISFLPCEKQEDEWVVWQKCCYYGGCDFDPIRFKDEYEAYKHACIKSLLSHIFNREHDLSGAYTKLADVNYECPEYHKCSGIDV